MTFLTLAVSDNLHLEDSIHAGSRAFEGIDDKDKGDAINACIRQMEHHGYSDSGFTASWLASNTML